MTKSTSACENFIKKVANILKVICIAMTILCLLGTFISFCILASIEELEEAYIIAIFGGSAIFFAIALLSTPFIWGYGDLIGNVGRLANHTPAPQKEEKSGNDVLPEL